MIKKRILVAYFSGPSDRPTCIMLLGASGPVVEYRARTCYPGHLQTTLSKLLAYCVLTAQTNSASYPQRDKKWVVSYWLQGEGL